MSDDDPAVCVHEEKGSPEALEASAPLCDSSDGGDVTSEFHSLFKKNLECRELREPSGATIGYDEL